ncbi:MAG TPA: hypothetical protein PK723_05185 [Candidatus Pacearchaeota archaeon]|nr:hypothetical protein [Candidatus Pacearchaeota archaeon]
MKPEKFTKKVILEDALEKIEDFSPSTLSELISFMNCCEKTFYNKIKVGSEEYEIIQEKLRAKKLQVANTAKAKLLMSDNPTALISIIKIYGSDEDRQALNQNINVNANTTINYEDVKKLEVNINKLSIEEQRTLNALLDKIRDE